MSQMSQNKSVPMGKSPVLRKVNPSSPMNPGQKGKTTSKAQTSGK